MLDLSPNAVTSTKPPIAFRLPYDVHVILVRRAKKMNMKPSDYLRRRVIYDICRSHHKRKGVPKG